MHDLHKTYLRSAKYYLRNKPVTLECRQQQVQSIKRNNKTTQIEQFYSHAWGGVVTTVVRSAGGR